MQSAGRNGVILELKAGSWQERSIIEKRERSTGVNCRRERTLRGHATIALLVWHSINRGFHRLGVIAREKRPDKTVKVRFKTPEQDYVSISYHIGAENNTGLLMLLQEG